MKKIINGRMYNTETAKFIGNYSYLLDSNDFRRFSESLYRKKTGAFFFYGWGGPMTKYAERGEDPNTWGDGEAITPCTEKEAKEWAEEHLSADKYIETFGAVEE